MLLFSGGGSEPREAIVELGYEPKPGTRLEIEGRTWHVIGPHVHEVGPRPFDVEVEPGAFDCQLVE
jgi:hypothetical protein